MIRQPIRNISSNKQIKPRVFDQPCVYHQNGS